MTAVSHFVVNREACFLEGLNLPRSLSFAVGRSLGAVV